MHLTKASPQNLTKSLKFDLQQLLPTPKLTSNIQFYKQKLKTYNFGIHNNKASASEMYLWDKTVAKRGAWEITSCISPSCQTLMTSLKNDYV